MKILYALFGLLGLLSVQPLIAQDLITLNPAQPAIDEEVTLTYYADSDEGDKGLADYTGEVYMHTGLLTSESTSSSDWKRVATEWGENTPATQLKRVDKNVYQVTFRINDLYGDPTPADIYGLTFVFRNASADRTGRAADGSDILYFWGEEMVFTNVPPQVLETSQVERPGWAAASTLYEVNVRQYTPEGTFAAFTRHLPRLKALGVDILWFMPIYPIGEENRKGPLGSYYSIRDYTAVNPEFGSMDDFRSLVEQCHALGFKVVLDWVANHTAWDHPWVTDHPDWYVRDAQGALVAPYDWTDVVKLDYAEAALREAMIAEMSFWVKEFGVDGFRCDVAGEVPVDFWEKARSALDPLGDIWLIAENSDQLFLLNRAFNANYGWPSHSLMNGLAQGMHSPAALNAYVQEQVSVYPNGTYPMHFTTNHDENSWNGTVFERMGELHRAMAVLSFTLPGMPLIYSGQEVGMDKRLRFFDKDTIEWSGGEDLTRFYTRLNELKSGHPALRAGDSSIIYENIINTLPEEIISFRRKVGKREVLVVINLSDDARKVKLKAHDLSRRYRPIFDGYRVLKRRKGAIQIVMPGYGYGVWVR